MNGNTSRIFISYRRDDAAGHAGRLYDALAARFGEENVWMDLGIEPGADFVERIDDALSKCAVLLAVIGERWAGDDRRRIDEPEDYVRSEIERGLRRSDVRVVPVLVQNVEMPTAAELPPTLAPLARRHAIELSDARWRYDVGRLVATLERAVGAERISTQPPSSGVLADIGSATPGGTAARPAEPPAVGSARHAPSFAVPLIAGAAAVGPAYLVAKEVLDAVDPNDYWKEVARLAAYRGTFWAVFGAILLMICALVGTRRARELGATFGLALAGAAGGALVQIARLEASNLNDLAVVVSFALTGLVLAAALSAHDASMTSLLGGCAGGALGALIVVSFQIEELFPSIMIPALATVVGAIASDALRGMAPAGEKARPPAAVR